MCGITGIFDSGNITPDECCYVDNATKVMFHRGPDESGFYSDSNCALGMRRLSIIDIAGGSQPKCSEDNNVIVMFNGEIYNYRELKDQMVAKGHKITSNCDTEVIPHLYEEYGVDLVKHLTGQFAIVIYDRLKRKIFLFRDRMGQKPVFYSVNGNRLTFGSEIKCVLQDPKVPTEVSNSSIYHYISLQYVPSPNTIYSSIKQLEPGCFMEFNGEAKIKRYWDVNYSNKISLPEEGIKEEVRKRVTEAVVSRLIADVPVGLFLSGGIDSSIVTGIVSQHHSNVRTFSIGFREKGYDESPDARYVANKFGTKHTEFVVTPNITEIIPRLTWHYDQPYGDQSCIPSFCLSEMASEYIKVALNGDGADELFGGYKRYFKMLNRINNHGAAINPDAYFTNMMMVWPNQDRQKILTREFYNSVKSEITQDILHNFIRKSGSKSPVDKALYCDMKSYLPEDIIVKMERMTMGHSIEGRSPFLDHNVVELACSIPWEHKTVNGIGKYILRSAFPDIIDQRIWNKKKKGFGVPMWKWIKNELSPLAHEILGKYSRLYQRGIFDPKEVTRFLNNNNKGFGKFGHRLWILISLEFWFRMYVDTKVYLNDNHKDIMKIKAVNV